MFSESLSLLRFITDPETRKMLASISGLVGERHKDWKKEIKTAKAKFHGDEPYKVSAFANYLFQELKSSGVFPKKLDEFRVVFTELVKNAFEHGCQGDKNCRVTIRCTYSRWFVSLEVKDSGKGFNFEEKLQPLDDVTEPPHGLQVVRNLACSLHANKKGNIVTAFLLGYERIEVSSEVEKFKGCEIVVLRVQSADDWCYINVNWDPLIKAMDNLGSSLILIDGVRWIVFTSGERRDVIKLTQRFQSRAGQYYAFVIDPNDNRFISSSMWNSENFKIFWGVMQDETHARAICEAKEWLVDMKGRHEQLKSLKEKT